jgi:mannose/fructose/N-acetylgalactosamine-specific phosphotransferase system component IID
MCLIISVVLVALGISFYLDGNTSQALLYFTFALPFVGFFIYRIIKYKSNKREK